MTQTRISMVVCAIMAYILCCFAPGCSGVLLGRYWMREETRALEVRMEGELRGYVHKTRDVLLPSVPVPPSEGEREVQETPDATPKPEDVRGDDEAAEEGARVNARTPPVDARYRYEDCFRPGILEVGTPDGIPIRVIDCAALHKVLADGNRNVACDYCPIGAYASAMKDAFGIRPGRVQLVKGFR